MDTKKNMIKKVLKNVCYLVTFSESPATIVIQGNKGLVT
jgi:hypothetical protein